LFIDAQQSVGNDLIGTASKSKKAAAAKLSKESLAHTSQKSFFSAFFYKLIRTLHALVLLFCSRCTTTHKTSSNLDKDDFVCIKLMLLLLLLLLLLL
jgi:hypothetical protein